MRRLTTKVCLRTRFRAVLALCFLSAITLARPAAAQNTPQGTSPQPTGSAQITGRVLARDNGAPVRRAVVRLSGVPAEVERTAKHAYVQREAETDDNGAFEFADLPDGSYYVSVPGTNGFLGLPRARQATVGDGQVLNVAIRLERTGAIVGRIADRNGEGLLGVQVQAISRHDFRGHISMMSRSSVATNDLGQFRLFNLQPGDYFVLATPAHRPQQQGAQRRGGFASTYFPGTQALGSARLVTVRAGKDSGKVNFSLSSGPLARVAIDAVDSRGQPLGREASATLNLVSDVFVPSSMRQASRQDDGQFVFSDVSPGGYYLIVSTSYRQEEAAYVNVTIDKDTTLKVQTNTGAKVSGRIVVQGPSRAPANGRPAPGVTISANRPLGKNGPNYATVPLAEAKGTDTFALTGLRGPQVLHASMAGSLLVAISRPGGDNLAGETVDFTGTESIDDLMVVFTNERAEVEVTLTGLREPDDPENVLVMLFAEDAARWHSGSLQYTAIQANAEMAVDSAATGRGHLGRKFTFQLGPVVPGRYLVAAVPSPDGIVNPTDRAILERLRPIAVPVTLVAGQTPKIEVRVSR